MLIHLLLACAIYVPSPSPAPAATGTSFTNAVVIKATDEDAGVKAEYAYLAAHPCSGGNWHVVQQALLTHGGKPYDVLTATCPGTDGARAFYFDISNYFGKM